VCVSAGVDVSWELLKISKTRGLEVVLADVGALPFRNATFDAVVSSFTICFVESVSMMLAESRRVLGDCCSERLTLVPKIDHGSKIV
jgi:ubiquinone/menaquinone biosynthesis C-methylase UbiE